MLELRMLFFFFVSVVYAQIIVNRGTDVKMIKMEVQHALIVRRQYREVAICLLL